MAASGDLAARLRWWAEKSADLAESTPVSFVSGALAVEARELICTKCRRRVQRIHL